MCRDLKGEQKLRISAKIRKNGSTGPACGALYGSRLDYDKVYFEMCSFY